MEEMIYKKPLLKDLKGIKEVLMGQGDPILASMMNRAIACVEKQPVADAIPVVHSRWDDSGRYHFVGGEKAVCCTKCGCALSQQEFERFHWNYCPVCGAKMDGERKDNGETVY